MNAKDQKSEILRERVIRKKKAMIMILQRMREIERQLVTERLIRQSVAREFYKFKDVVIDMIESQRSTVEALRVASLQQCETTGQLETQKLDDTTPEAITASIEDASNTYDYLSSCY
jgi:hypothetical protein